MKCQLKVMPEAGADLSGSERVIRRLSRQWHRLARKAHKVLHNPTLVFRKQGRSTPNGETCAPDLAAESSDSPCKLPALGLKPGQRVQVKSCLEIRRTLDEQGRYEGCAYMPPMMDKYCGGTYTVKKRVDLFFDERNWHMTKLRNIVILEGVYCEPPVDSEDEFAGCARTCFLFWKEAWLRRVPV